MPLGTISSLFNKYKNITPPDHKVRVSACGCILDIVGVSLTVKDVSVDRGVLIVNTSPTIRNEIFIRKTHILACVEKDVGSETPKDIN